MAPKVAALAHSSNSFASGTVTFFLTLLIPQSVHEAVRQDYELVWQSEGNQRQREIFSFDADGDGVVSARERDWMSRPEELRRRQYLESFPGVPYPNQYDEQQSQQQQQPQPQQ